VCFGTTVMHAPHKCRGDWDVRRGDARVVQRVSALVVHATLALEHNRDEIFMEQTKALVELTLRGWKSAATIGRHRNPSPDTSLGV